MTTTEPATTSEPPADRDADRVPWSRRLIARLPDPVTSVVVLTVATFALLGIGSPLLGVTSFAGTDTLAHLSPQRDESMADVELQTINMGDTVDFSLPNATYFGEELRRGEYPEWNPYILGGVPMAATPNFAVLSPVALPFWFLPGWLAPGYMKLLELIVAIGGTYLFLRRVRLGRAAGWLGGLVFASSGYLVVWSNWPQSRVAAFIPVLFWALERLVAERRIRDVALLALPVASMILSGFPSVTGYAVLTGGCYCAARVLAEHRGQWRRIAGLLAGGVAGVAAGTALVAFQLLPWIHFMSTTLIRGRTQGPEHIIPPEMLLTTLAPYLFGTVNPGDPPTWFHARIFIEYSFYVGAAALVLVIIGVAAARRACALLPRGLWWFLLSASGTWLVLMFHGGAPLAAAQQLPVLFSQNFVGRGRSVLGFLLAALAAIGFQLLLNQRRSRQPAPSPSWLSRGYAVAVWLTAGLAGLVLIPVARRIAHQQNTLRNPDGQMPHFADHMMTELWTGLGFAAVAAMCAAWLWWGPTPSTAGFRRHAATVAAALVPVLVGVQALLFVVPYHPRTDPQHFYPMTNAATYLKTHLGHQRFYGGSGAIYGGIEVPHRIRALHGHIYLDRRLAELVETMPGQQFDTPPTYLNGDTVGGKVARHPVLDRLAVSHYMVSPQAVPYGTPHLDTGDGTAVRLEPGRPVTVGVTASGPVRGVGVTPQVRLTSPEPTTRVRVSLRDVSGTTVAEADRIVRELEPGKPFYVPLAAEAVAAGTKLTATIEITGPTAIDVSARGAAPAVSIVTATDDGLRLVYDDSSVIYERTNALPRARWASSAVVAPDADRRLELLAGGSLAPDQVVLDKAGSPADGEPARVRWIDDGNDEMALSVEAEGAGYLVVADAIQSSWSATVDGKPAELVPADHGLAAVAVPAGRHTVRLFYTAPYGNAGGWISGLTVLLLVGLVGYEWWRGRRRDARRVSPDGPSGHPARTMHGS